MQNPLYPSDAASGQGDPYAPVANYAQPAAAPVQNLFGAPAPASSAEPAVDMIRQKIRDLYSEEPGASAEIIKAEAHTLPGSQHQEYMRQLNESGMSLVEIQTAWHNYYVKLPEHEKYQVWQDFYVQNGTNPVQQHVQSTPAQQALPEPVQTFAPRPQTLPAPTQSRDRQLQRTASIIDQAALRARSAVNFDSAAVFEKRVSGTIKNVTSSTSDFFRSKQGTGKGVKLQAKHHFQSLVFGLGMGGVVVFIFLFSFFNEFMIAPLIQPSRKINDTPVIVDVASTVVSGGPKVLIPKINLEIPVDYTQTTTDEKQIELALDKGIVHYPTTVRPGQTGNAAYFGHSSNNIFNPGKYKFAFVLLHELVEGDTFYMSDNGKTYAYKVFSKRIVEPSEVSVLGPVAGHPATATLITCDPPGTSLHRLVVVGDQISPDATGNPAPAATPAVQTASVDSGLPGNGPTLWSRIWATIF